jgi:hypothetical protein
MTPPKKSRNSAPDEQIEEVADIDVTTPGLDIEKDSIDPITDLSDDPFKDMSKEHQSSNEGGIVPEDEVVSEGSEGLPAGTPGHPGIDEGTE